jgi:hypothetical protein
LLQTRPLLRIRLRNSSKDKLPPAIIPRASALQKLILLIRRDFRLLWRDRTAFLMLAIPPLVALVHFVLSSSTTLNPLVGNPGQPPIVFDLLVFLVLLTAALLVQNEILKERVVFQREHRISSLLFPYVLSKVWLVGILAIYQGLVWTIIHSFGEIGRGPAGGLPALLPSGIILCLVAFVGGILGLTVSALSRTATTTTSWVLLLTVPQLLFIFDPLSHWSKLALMGLLLIVLLVGIQYGAASVRT